MEVGYKEQSCVSGRRSARAEPAAERIALTARDREIVRWVFGAGLATREHIHRLFFSPKARSRCQRRLTLLYRNRFLDRLPDRAVNAPDVYYLSRRSSQGLRLLRSIYPDSDVRPHPLRHLQIDHALAVASCRVAITAACSAAGFTVKSWLSTSELSGRMPFGRLLPDAYVQLAHSDGLRQRTSGFFLEVERSGKSSRSLEEKFSSYGQFYYGGGYASVFGTSALRVLVLVGSDYGIVPERQIAKFAAICRRLNVTIFRFCALKEFLAQPASDLLFARIWRRPEDDEPCALFPR